VQAPGFYEKLGATTRALCDRLTAAGQQHGIPFSARAIGGMFGLYFRETPPESYAEVMQSDAKLFNAFFHAMLGEGIYLAPSMYEAGFVSAAHGTNEIEKTIAAADRVFEGLRG
jgi:glutamate-1-semialdehyde 2,1-aminomutase